MGISRIACYLEGYEDFGILIGILLSQNNFQKDKDYEKYRKTSEFRRQVTKEIDEFTISRENDVHELENYYNR